MRPRHVSDKQTRQPDKPQEYSSAYAYEVVDESPQRAKGPSQSRVPRLDAKPVRKIVARALKPLRASSTLPVTQRASLKHFLARQSGWRLGVFLGVCLSSAVLCGNIILLFVGFRYTGYNNGIGILAQGRSDSMARMSTVYHILINLLSTLLLCASNYSMQVLCSPTREDIDRAHADGTYLDVGVLSPRNISFMKGSRASSWYILLVTSISLHLLYRRRLPCTLSLNIADKSVAVTIRQSQKLPSAIPTLLISFRKETSRGRMMFLWPT